MEDQKPPAKVSEFAGRREKRDAPKLAIQNPPTPGGDQGTFEREPCGTCIHWKKNPAQGVGFGNCMMMPPQVVMVMTENGPGAVNVRPGMRADIEGCDQHEEEGEDEEGEGLDAPRPAIAAAG